MPALTLGVTKQAAVSL